MEFNDDLPPIPIEDHHDHGPECIHSQLQKASYEDLIQAYSHIETAASALDFMISLDMVDAITAPALDAIDAVDFLGGALYAELHRRGSSVALPPSEN